MIVPRSPPGTPVGLLPAAGHARRLALSEGSKELLEVPDLDAPSGAWIPVSHYLLRQYRAAGIVDVVVARRAPKTDLAAHLHEAAPPGFAIHDVVVAPTPGSAHTLALAAAEVPDRIVAAGFPDIVLTPASLCRDALARLAARDADVCLAHVPIPAHERGVWDMSTFDGDRVVDLAIRPAHLDYDVAWCLAVWRPAFSAFLREWIAGHDGEPRVTGEVSLTHVLAGAIDAGLHVTSIVEPRAYAIDVGQPERLARARSAAADGRVP